jgi:hypothetical protein
MDEVVIALFAPVSVARIDRWVEEQVDRLRTEAAPTGVGLGPLVRASPAGGGDWLIGVDLADRSVRLQDHLALACVLTDLERLGLRPALLVVSPAERTAARARSPSRALRRARTPCGPRVRRSPPV